jgi:flagellar M-ring protein FliF
MSDIVPATQVNPAASLAMFADPGAGNALTRIRSLAGQPAVRRALPWFAGIAGLGALALTYSVLSPAPQRTLYGQLDDADRASVVASLDKAAIPYKIDNATGALTVNEDDLYRARMLVASDGALATPESGTALLDSLPLGASRTMEGERLRAARERELMLTIKEIDGVEAVRVHLAEPEQSVFVRENNPPSASVMLRLAKGRQLSDSQVTAIANLVASSVSGLSIDDVRIVDQHGRLLSQKEGQKADPLDLQSRMEGKLRTQVNQLLTPVLGADNFSTEVQVRLDMDEKTSARETYEKDGAVRQETEESSHSENGSATVGVPGILSNTPPLPAKAEEGAPQGSPAPSASPAPNQPMVGESRASRTYELGREVAVLNSTPGQIKQLSVAVALSATAMKKAKAADIEKIRELVSAAVGADPKRGDQVAVMVRSFDATEMEQPQFYETAWFATLVRNGVALLGVLLVLLLGVRPLLRMLNRNSTSKDELPTALTRPAEPADAPLHGPNPIDRSLLNRQVGAAQRLVEERPDRAVIALRQMLNQSQNGAS